MEQKIVIDKEVMDSKVSLWSNPMIDAARKAMSPEDLEKYDKLGQSLYKDIDFISSEVIDEDSKYPMFIRDAIAYIYESLKSGIHPSMLTKEEIQVMTNFDGETWYEKWGYIKDDLTDIVTVQAVIPEVIMKEKKI